MTPVGMMPTFGSMTLGAATGPRALNKANTKEMAFISMTSAKPPVQGEGGKIDKQTAQAYQGIRASMMPEQQGNRSLLGKIADMIVGNKLAKAAGGQSA